MPDNQHKTADTHLRQRIKKIIDTQYEVENNQTVESLINSTISNLGDHSETGEIFLVQAIDFAIEQLVSESEGTPLIYQDAINYGGGLK